MHRRLSSTAPPGTALAFAQRTADSIDAISDNVLGVSFCHLTGHNDGSGGSPATSVGKGVR